MSQLAIDRQTLVGRDYIETLDWTVEEIDEALAVAGELKTAFRNGVRLTGFSPTRRSSCSSRQVDPHAQRLRVGHDAARRPCDLPRRREDPGRARESPKDMGIILPRYGHGLAIRHDLAPTRATRGCARSRAGRTSSSSTCSATSTTRRRPSPT